MGKKLTPEEKLKKIEHIINLYYAFEFDLLGTLPEPIMKIMKVIQEK